MKPDRICAHSLWAGYLMGLCAYRFYMDMMGQERMIDKLQTAWVNTHPLLWFALICCCYGYFVYITRNVPGRGDEG